MTPSTNWQYPLLGNTGMACTASLPASAPASSSLTQRQRVAHHLGKEWLDRAVVADGVVAR